MIKNALGGPITEVILISDDADVYFNAWSAVMDAPAHRLLCVACRQICQKIQIQISIKRYIDKLSIKILHS